MIGKLLNKLEDPLAPFMGPYIRFLNFSGLFMPEKGAKRYLYLFLHAMEFLFGATELIDLWSVKSDMMLLLNNLKISMLAAVTVVKAATFLSWQRHWRDILNYVNTANMEQRKSSDEENRKIVSDTTAFTRKVSYLYWLLGFTTALSTILAPFFKYMLSSIYRENVLNGVEEYMPVISSWVPFDKSTIPGYCAASAYQIYAVILAAIWIVPFDTNAFAIMSFIKCEIQLLRRDSSKIFGADDSPVNIELAGRRIKECHNRHLEMIKCVKLFNSCLSPVMIVYVIVCSIMICVTCYQFSVEKNTMQRILIAVYLVFGVFQLFLYCWHSNDVLYVSADLYLGPYESLWWKQTAHRKDILFLMIQFSRKIVFTAGPVLNIAVPTFISILKGAYSYYTVLSQSEM